MDRGRVLADGTPHAVLTAPAVVSAYIGADDRAAHRSGPRAATGPGADAGAADARASSAARPPAGPSVDSPAS
jgi:hypothetical protein